MPSKNPNNHEQRIVGEGAGLKFKTPPLSVRFPPDILNYLRSRRDAKGRKDAQVFVRAAVAEKLAREGINIEASIDPTQINN